MSARFTSSGNAPAPIILEAKRSADIPGLHIMALDALAQGRRVSVLATCGNERHFCFMVLPTIGSFAVIGVDPKITGRQSSAEAAVRMGMRQVERLLGGFYD